MNLGNRYSQHSFAQIPSVNIPRSKFDRSYSAKDTMMFDELNPIFIEEVIPGDTHNLTLNSFARLATQLVPIMDNLYMDYFFFFVPNRLVWQNWEKFNGAQDNPGDSTDFIVPYLGPYAGTSNLFFNVGSVADKFGLPTDVLMSGSNIPKITALPFRAYNLIWNEWFRDQNLQNSVVVHKDDGPDHYDDYVILKRGKRHDYFTSCLPWPQKGAAVTLPMGTTAPLTGAATVNSYAWGTNLFLMDNTTGRGHLHLQNTGTAPQPLYSSSAGSVGTPEQLQLKVDTTGIGVSGSVDLSAATAVTINQLRQAIMTQSLLELDARGGTRYIEILRAHFGVVSPDFRLQRPEYLGGGSVKINVHPIAQTSASGTTPQGNLAAMGTMAVTSRDGVGFSKSFVEHGYIIGLAAARADITYQSGLNKMWSRSTRYDFYWPKLQELGEQAVLKQEIYLSGVKATNESVFGYQERYGEYRYRPSEIRGQFRSSYATPLDMWHMAEEFVSAPSLNSTFITSSTPIARAIAVPGSVDLLVDMYFKLYSARPMMTYSVPATLGRF